MTPLHISSFSQGDKGGNPAGVVICDALPDAAVMQKIAAQVGYSETAFAAPHPEGWRVRYFAPVGEVPFCGHATIALGAALGAQEGPGVFALQLNDAQITVEAQQEGGRWQAALQSPATWSKPMPDDLRYALLDAFALSDDDLDLSLPPILAHAGALHGILTLKRREKLAQMAYPFDSMRALMALHGLVTVSLLVAQAPRQFVSRNAFASGGVVEDPATGAAAAALAGALVDMDWDGLRAGGHISITQGEDMGMPSSILAEVTGEPAASVRVSGTVRWMDA